MQPLTCGVLDASLCFAGCRICSSVFSGMPDEVLKWEGKILDLSASRHLFSYSQVLEYRSGTDKILRHSTMKIVTLGDGLLTGGVLGWIFLCFCSILEYFPHVSPVY